MAYFRALSGGGGGTNLIVGKVLASNQNNSTADLTLSYTASKAINVLAISVGSMTSNQSTGTPTYTSNLTPIYTHEYVYPYNGSTRMRSVYAKVSVYSLNAGDTLTLGCNLSGVNYRSKSISIYEIPSVSDYTLGDMTSKADTAEDSLTTDKNILMYANKGNSTITGTVMALPSWETLHTRIVINSETDTYTAKSSQGTNGTVALIEIQKG